MRDSQSLLSTQAQDAIGKGSLEDVLYADDALVIGADIQILLVDVNSASDVRALLVDVHWNYPVGVISVSEPHLFEAHRHFLVGVTSFKRTGTSLSV